MSTFGKDLYSESYNLRFYHITKNAMTSVIKSFDLKWVDIEKIPDDARVFCILRNPSERAVSSYCEIEALMKKSKYRLKSYPFFQRDIAHKKILEIFLERDKRTSVLKYVDEIVRNGFFDSHHLPQVEFLNRKKRKRNIDDVDFYLDFADLEKGLKRITSEKIRLRHLNKKSARKKNRISDYFKEHEQRLSEIYADDWKLYRTKILESRKIDKEKR